MSNNKITIFPETEEIFTPEFVQLCVNHVTSLGYYSKIHKSQICIIDANGQSSCTMGTLVGWKFVNAIEDFLALNGFPWFRAPERTRDEMAKGFAIAGQLSNIVAELIKIENEDESI